MLMTPQSCWRGRTVCEPLHAIEGLPDDITREEFEAPDFRPESFVCCGLNHASSRELPQNAYRLCFVNEVSDEITDNDLQDLTHISAVISQALAISATRIVNSGSVTVPTAQGDVLGQA